MCTIAVAWKIHPLYPLILVANRDEYYQRPTEAMRWQPQNPDLLCGRDLESGGIWTGFMRDGRWGVITNVRKPKYFQKNGLSRGKVLCDYFENGKLDRQNDLAAGDFSQYNGFNLLIGDGDSLYYATNDNFEMRKLSSGIYGLSNARLDTPWPKVSDLKKRFSDYIHTEKLLQLDELEKLMMKSDEAPDSQLPQTGVPLEWERRLSALFIQTPEYGTRATSICLIDTLGNAQVRETSHFPNNQAKETRDFLFKIIKSR
jgi:uncharacterized protein with NRDE domain